MFPISFLSDSRQIIDGAASFLFPDYLTGIAGLADKYKRHMHDLAVLIFFESKFCDEAVHRF